MAFLWLKYELRTKKKIFQIQSLILEEMSLTLNHRLNQTVLHNSTKHNITCKKKIYIFNSS